MYTSTLAKILDKLVPEELAILIDKDTDISLLLQIIRETNSIRSGVDRSAHILSVLFAVYHKKLGNLQSIINSISYSKLCELRKWNTLLNSYAGKEIIKLIEQRRNALKQEVETIDTCGEEIILFDDATLFNEIAVDRVWLDVKILLRLFDAKNLVLLSTKPLELPSNWERANWYTVLPWRDERLKTPMLRKYIDMKKYPKIARNGGMNFSYSLRVLNKNNKFYWELDIIPKLRPNDDKTLIEEKQKLVKELSCNFKFQHKEVDYMVGTEEELLEKLKQRFPKKEVQA